MIQHIIILFKGRERFKTIKKALFGPAFLLYIILK